VIFMSILWPFILILSVFLQYGSVSNFPTGTFTEKEAKKIEKESEDLDGRIDVYRNASIRMQKELKETVSKDGFQDIPGRIQLWTSLVTESLKALIKYEIHVRQTINDLRELQLRAPYEHQKIFDICIERANNARGQMVDILFQPEKVLEEEVER
jgi:hypothetical protein